MTQTEHPERERLALICFHIRELDDFDVDSTLPAWERAKCSMPDRANPAYAWADAILALLRPEAERLTKGQSMSDNADSVLPVSHNAASPPEGREPEDIDAGIARETARIFHNMSGGSSVALPHEVERNRRNTTNAAGCWQCGWRLLMYPCVRCGASAPGSSGSVVSVDAPAAPEGT